MARTTPSKAPAAGSLDEVAKEYLTLKESIDMLDKRKSELRDKLFAFIDTDGEVDDKGNIWLDLPDEIGKGRALQKQMRVTRSLNEEQADEIIEKAGIGDLVYKTVRVVDQDAVMGCLYQGTLTEEEVDAMYPPKVTWALTTPKR